MYIQRLIDIGPAVLLPIFLAMCLVCGIASFFVIQTTPEGLNPIEALGLRVYLLRNDEALNTPLGTDPTSIQFEIETGDSANDVGIKLVTQGIISNGSLFARYARFEGRDNDLRPGVYLLNRTMTIPEVLDRLTDTTPTTVPFLIRENMRMEQIAQQIDATPLLDFSGDEFLALVRGGAPIPDEFRQRYGIPAGASLEGFLYPAVYDLPLSTTAEAFRDRLLQTFEQSVSQELIDEASRQGRSIYQYVILASIIELEAVLDEERPLIASVYWNRLDSGQKLDADPTVQYQLANNRGDGIWWPSITTSDYLNATGPYNTYINLGLPPGPLVSPALRSIRAALFPAQTNYLYFQASCEGGGRHVFFDNIDEHNAYFQRRLNGCV